MTIEALRAVIADAEQDASTPPTTMTKSPAPTTAPAPQLSVGKLLAWGDTHDDRTVRHHAARARDAIAALRERHAADTELTQISQETEQLEARLAELRARERALAPPKKRRRSAGGGPAAAEVREWARTHGVDCPPKGRIPTAVMQAWQAAHADRKANVQ